MTGDTIQIKTVITHERIKELMQLHSIPVNQENLDKIINRIRHDIEFIEFECKLAVAREMEYIMYRLIYDGVFSDKPISDDQDAI